MQSSTSVHKKSRKAILLFSNLEIKKARNGPFNYDINRRQSCLLSKFDINHEMTTDDETQVLYLYYSMSAIQTRSQKTAPKYPSDFSIPEPGRNIFDLLP